MKDLDHEILLKHFQGEASSDEQESINSWIEENEENKRDYLLLKKIWETPDINIPRPDTAKAFLKVKERLKLDSSESSAKIFNLSRAKDENKYFRNIFTSRFIRAAALFLIVAGTAFYISNIYKNVKIIDVKVDAGKIEKMLLPDGTSVTLDAGSTLSYPEKFGGNREVSLSGEAYFEVASNKEKPFIVNTQEAVITVLGTKFNVNAWEVNQRIELAVAEGSVSFHSQKGGEKDKVIVTAGQISKLHDGGIPEKPRNADVSNYISWLNREKYFSNTRLYEVVSQIERWYNINMNMPPDYNLSTRITINISSKPIAEVLELFSAVLNLDYKIQNRNVFFTER